MEKNTVVQIVAKDGDIDKSLNGVLGYVQEDKGGVVLVKVYHPQEKGKGAFATVVEVPPVNLRDHGQPELKPFK